MLKTRSLLAIPIALALGFTLAGPTAVANDDFDAPPKALSHQDTAREKAADTLAQVQAVVDGDAVSRGGHTTDGRDLTIALRDLKLQMKHLSPADRKTAQQFYMRPGNGTDPYIPGSLPLVQCGPQICVHYAAVGVNASDPTYVTQVLNTIEQINTDYIAAGYRTPVRDGALGGDSDKIDIYLGNIGNQGLYGFCTTDDPKADLQNPPSWDVWAYCALDNDYDPSEFPTNTPIENMQVTAAHEFFHAVQYAYDFADDGWLLESTATWVEDEMFDDVNDNRNYLDCASNQICSPLHDPYVPIDYFGGTRHYGTWIFWRYLTEKFPAKTGKLPNLVLDVWKRLDGAVGGPNRYSTQGLAEVLNNRGTRIKTEIIKFHAANRRAKQYYDEGGAYTPSPALVLGLGANKAKAGVGQVFHMASNTVRFNPKNLGASNWKLRLSFDLPPTARGASAVIVVYRKNGKVDQTIVKLSKTGNATRSVAFSSGAIKGVDAIFVNSSTRFADCYEQNSPYSCSGIPRDDPVNENELKYRVTGRTFR